MVNALLIGINDYPDSPLVNCVNDVTSVEKLLSDNYQNLYVKTLKNKQATKAAIILNFRMMVQRLKENDILYVLFSGHGTQVRTTKDAWELDGKDEIICPYFEEYTLEALITDNEIFEILQQKHRQSLIIFISDSCHSGDLGRSVASRQKFLSIPEWVVELFQGDAAKRLKVEPYSLQNVVIISACKSTEVAMDGGNGIKNGRFTHEMLASLLENPKQTFEQLIANVQKRCKGIQTPQLQCTKTLRKRPFFAPKPVRYQKPKTNQ